MTTTEGGYSRDFEELRRRGQMSSTLGRPLHARHCGFVRVGEKEQVIFLELRAAELGFPDVGVGDDSPAGTRVLVFNVPVSAALAPGHASTPAGLARARPPQFGSWASARSAVPSRRSGSYCGGDGHYQLHLLSSPSEYRHSERTCEDSIDHPRRQIEMAGSGYMPVYGRLSAHRLRKRSTRNRHVYDPPDLHTHSPCHRDGNATAYGGAYSHVIAHPKACGDRPRGGAEGPRLHADHRER